MKILIVVISLILKPVAVKATLWSGPSSGAQSLNSGDQTVIGSGSTSEAAYKDAQNRLPSGAQVVTVQTKQSGDTWYVTISYRPRS